MVEKAEIGDSIQFKEEMIGVVEKVYENSVMVDITDQGISEDFEVGGKTIVNHKTYQIIDRAE